MKQATVKIVQLSQQLWQIESQKGAVLQKNIVASSYFEAKEYIKNYCSSYGDWTYEVVAYDKTKKTIR